MYISRAVAKRRTSALLAFLDFQRSERTPVVGLIARHTEQILLQHVLVDPATHLAAAHDKLAALVPLAEVLDLPLMGVASDALAAVSTPTRSIASLNARHVGSVAEASALAAAGAGARLLSPRHISPDRMATCAIAASVNLQEIPT